MLKRILIYGIALLVLAALVFGGWYMNQAKNKMIADIFNNMQQPPVTISAAPVTAETWSDSIEAIGTLSAVRGVDVTPEAAGIVTQILFQPGERVEEGRVLVQLDDQVEQADLALYTAQANLASSTLQRTTSLANRGNAATASVETAQADLAVAQAQMSRVQALIEQKAIRAPFEGIVGIRRVNVGQYLQPGTPVVTLQALDRLFIDFRIPEQYLPQIALQQQLKVTVDAFPGQVFEGEITGIDPAIDASTRTIAVQGTLGNPDRLLRPGIFARVSIVLPDRPNVTTVPETAVTYNLYGSTVFKVVPAEPAPDADPNAPPPLQVQQTFVRTGATNRNRVEILEGLKPGDTVVTSGQLKLQSGFRVMVDNTVDPATQPAPPGPGAVPPGETVATQGQEEASAAPETSLATGAAAPDTAGNSDADAAATAPAGAGAGG